MTVKRPGILSGPARLWDYHAKTTEELFRLVGNTGNLAFRYAVQKHLGRNTPFFAWGARAVAVRAKADVVVIPCANQIGSHFDGTRWAEVLAEIALPVVAVGLGAQATDTSQLPAIPDGTKRWLREMVERAPAKAPNISVRGEYSRRCLEALGLGDAVEVLGCPSLFISDDPHLGRTIAARLGNGVRRVGVAAGNYALRDLALLERRLFQIAYDSGGSYIVQHPIDFIRFARAEDSSLPEATRRQIGKYVGLVDPHGTPSPGERRTMRVFFDIDAWMEEVRRHDLVVGTRIHGVMLALQAGVPAVCIVHDSRTEEMCSHMNVPHVRAANLEAGDVSVKTLIRLASIDWARFDNNRRSIGRNYSKFLRSNGLEVSDREIIFSSTDSA